MQANNTPEMWFCDVCHKTIQETCRESHIGGKQHRKNVDIKTTNLHQKNGEPLGLNENTPRSSNVPDATSDELPTNVMFQETEGQGSVDTTRANKPIAMEELYLCKTGRNRAAFQREGNASTIQMNGDIAGIHKSPIQEAPEFAEDSIEIEVMTESSLGKFSLKI